MSRIEKNAIHDMEVRAGKKDFKLRRLFNKTLKGGTTRRKMGRRLRGGGDWKSAALSRLQGLRNVHAYSDKVTDSDIMELSRSLVNGTPIENAIYLHDPSGMEFQITDIGRREDEDLSATLGLLQSLILLEVGETTEYAEYGDTSTIRRLR